MIGRMLETGRVWFAPMREIAAHVQRCITDGSWVPRIDAYPPAENTSRRP